MTWVFSSNNFLFLSSSFFLSISKLATNSVHVILCVVALVIREVDNIVGIVAFLTM